MVAATHIATVVDFRVEHEVVSVIAISNGETLVWTFPLPVFRRCYAKAGCFLETHDAAGHVVGLRKR